jgi:hypothetical protein
MATSVLSVRVNGRGALPPVGSIRTGAHQRERLCPPQSARGGGDRGSGTTRGDNTHQGLESVRGLAPWSAENARCLEETRAQAAPSATVTPPRPLAETDDRNSFDCGRESMNAWFSPPRLGESRRRHLPGQRHLRSGRRAHSAEGFPRHRKRGSPDASRRRVGAQVLRPPRIPGSPVRSTPGPWLCGWSS